MNQNLPDLLPQCANHGRMSLRPGRTKEQVWCGTWYECTSARCQNSALLPSAELVAQLVAMR